MRIAGHRIGDKTNMIVTDQPSKIKTPPHPTDADDYTRCAGCFSWAPIDDKLVIHQTDNGIGFALCWLCDIRSKRFRWRFERIQRNVEAYLDSSWLRVQP